MLVSYRGMTEKAYWTNVGGRNIIIDGTTDFRELDSRQLWNSTRLDTAIFLVDLIFGPYELV